MDGTKDELVQGMAKCQMKEEVGEDCRPAAGTSVSGARMGGSDDMTKGPAPPEPDQPVMKTMIRELTAVQVIVEMATIDDPFAILPEEVWERILGELENSQDIENVFRAYPGLEGFVLKNKYSWLMDQVIPHLHPWLPKQELLTCRQVSQRWCRAVDNYLDNHPSRRAHDHDDGRQIWVPEASPAYACPLDPLDWDCFRMSRRFGFDGQAEQLAQFLHDMESHFLTGRNPFVGRSVEFQQLRYGQEDGIDQYWNAALEIVRKYGEHIWFLKVHSPFTSPTHFYQLQLDDILPLLPNLKSLSVHGIQCLDAEVEALIESRRDTLPHLPHLETLIFEEEDSPTPLVDILVTRYSKQIRRLDMHSDYWREEDSSLFTNLTELHLRGIIHNYFLDSLDAPNLSGLRLELQPHPGVYTNMLLAYDLVTWLKRFPRVERVYVNLHYDMYKSHHYDWDCYYDMSDRERRKVVRSLLGPLRNVSLPVKSLVIEEHDWENYDNLDFLVHFPALEPLEIVGVNQEAGIVSRNMEMCGDKLWGMLRKLEGITVKESWAGSVHMSRSRYECLKTEKAEQRRLATPELESLCEAFNSMVGGSWGNELPSENDE